MSSYTLEVPPRWAAAVLRQTTAWQNIDDEEVRARVFNAISGISPSPILYASDMVRAMIQASSLLRLQSNWEQFDDMVGVLVNAIEKMVETEKETVEHIRMPSYDDYPKRPPTKREIAAGAYVNGWVATYVGWM